MELNLDVKYCIASCFEEVWIRLALYDAGFTSYAYSLTGINQFKALFTLPIQLGYCIEYRLLKKLHREHDLPAIVCNNGTKEWWFEGKRHRENDRPAVVYANGDQKWWVKDKRHRENDRPAVIRANGDQEWWFEGKVHRENDQPAIIRTNGYQEWWFNGKQYRI